MQMRASKQKGFTIVELLVVIVVIAVLAAVTVVAYNGIQRRAQAAAVSSSLNHVAKKLRLYQVDNGMYPAALTDVGVTDDAVTYQYASTSTTYCITGTQGSTSLYVSTTQQTPTAGGCPGHGQGGTAAVTNLLSNPSVELSDAGLYRWFGSSPGAGINERVASIGLNGGYAVRKTWSVSPGTSADAGFQWAYSAPTVGQTYTCSAYATASVNQQMHARLEFYDIANTRFANANGGTMSVSANTLTRMNVTGTVPANTVRLQCVVDVDTGGSYVNFVPGNSMWADAAMLTEGTTLYPYADGASSNWIWNGATHASTSTGPAL